MIIANYYQPWLFPFLSLRKRYVPDGITRYTYHSFEDGLWDLLQHRGVARGAVILVPDFYCMDVISNIQNHGYTVVMYPLNKQFQIRPATLIPYLRNYHPAAIIIFHASGITSYLMNDTSWISYATPATIIVEDCVHRLVDPSRVTVIGDRHYVMDSIRKVTPLPGSFLYGSNRALNYPQIKAAMNWYVVVTSLYYLAFRMTYTAAVLMRSPRMIRVAHTRILKKYDDTIGDPKLPSRGFTWAALLLDRINFQKVEKMKKEQVRIYEKYLADLTQPFYRIIIPASDYGKLHAYPLGFSGPPDESLIRYLHARGIVVWFKFTDAPWSKRRGVLYLPLGFHIGETHIAYIAGYIRAWVGSPA